jgi:predicted permease
MLTDVRDAWRALRRHPAAAIVAVATLALGVGANTAVVSVFESILVNALPYPNAARLISIAEPGASREGRVSAWMAHEWEPRSRAIEAVGLYTDGQWVLTGDGTPEVLRGQRVNAQLFAALGVRPFLGRLLTPEDDCPPRKDVVVLSYELWATRFGADREVIDRTYTLNGAPHRVVGVLGKNFQPFRMSNAGEQPRMYAPLGFDAAQAARCRHCAAANASALLAPGTRAEQARDEVAAASAGFRRAFPREFAVDFTVRIEPLQHQITAALRPALWIALGAAGCVLLIACANLASLQLTRAGARAGEFAVRGAIGGSRWRVARLLILESLLIAAAGCGAGVLLGRTAIDGLLAASPRELPRLGEIALDRRVLFTAIAAGTLAALAAALAPVFAAARIDLNDVLKRHADARGGRGARARRALVAAQVTLAFVLVTATGLLIRTVHELLTVDAGFDAAHVLTLTPVFQSRPGMADRAILAERQRAIDAVQALPGVTAAGLVNDVPLSHTNAFGYAIEGEPPSDADQPEANVFWVEGRYFDALRIPLRAGRLLTRQDDDTHPAVVVSESLARHRFPRGDAIGRRVRFSGPDAEWMTIVGIVGDVRNAGLDTAPDEAIYQPLAMRPGHYIRVVARAAGDPMRLERSIRVALQSIDPLVAIFHVQPMDDYVASSMAQRRFALGLIALSGAIALMLACVGLYGVLGYMVVLRLPELGVRAALGAGPAHLLRLVLREGLLMVGSGLACGSVLALVTTRLLGSLLFGVGAVDPLTFAAASAVIGLAALAACTGPARRAARVDPLRIIRS